MGARGRFRHNECPRDLPMESGLSFIHFRAFVVSRRHDRPDGETKGLAVMAAHSHDRDGRVLHFAVDGLLCGQWAKSAAVAAITSAGLLVSADAYRRADSRERAALASAGETAKFKLTHDYLAIFLDEPPDIRIRQHGKNGLRRTAKLDAFFSHYDRPIGQDWMHEHLIDQLVTGQIGIVEP